MHCQTNCVLNVDKSAIIVRPTVNSVVLPMELDTGSAILMILLMCISQNLQTVNFSLVTRCYAVSLVNQCPVKVCLR